jgi:hypothetical protein
MPQWLKGAIAARFQGDYGSNSFARASDISAASPAPMIALCD